MFSIFDYIEFFRFVSCSVSIFTEEFRRHFIKPLLMKSGMKACLNLIENINECLVLHPRVNPLFRGSVSSSQKRRQLREVVLEYIKEDNNRLSLISKSIKSSLEILIRRNFHSGLDLIDIK